MYCVWYGFLVSRVEKWPVAAVFYRLQEDYQAAVTLLHYLPLIPPGPSILLNSVTQLLSHINRPPEVATILRILFKMLACFYGPVV